MTLTRSWLGDSVGWWEGATLVVEIVGGHTGVTNRGAHLVTSGATRVTERFTRSGPDELFYPFRVEDPGLYTRPWGGEMALSRATGRMFEYACHEGNYSLPGILAGARRGEWEVAPLAGQRIASSGVPCYLQPAMTKICGGYKWIDSDRD